jgi:hypothetical protein
MIRRSSTGSTTSCAIRSELDRSGSTLTTRCSGSKGYELRRGVYRLSAKVLRAVANSSFATSTRGRTPYAPA